MKIEDFMIWWELLKANPGVNQEFQKGEIVKGEIIEQKDGFIIIDIKNFGLIKAKSEFPLDGYRGKTLNFIVKELLPDRIRLKPLPQVFEERNPPKGADLKEEFSSKVLKNFNIKPSLTSIRFLENLVEFNLPINEKNLISGINLLDKMSQLQDIREEGIFFHPNIRQEYGEKNLHIKNEDIRNLLIVDKIPPESRIDFQDLKRELNIEIKAIEKLLPKGQTQETLEKTMAFFIKYDIRPSLNNIKNFLKLNTRYSLFDNRFSENKEVLGKKFTNLIKRIIISSGSPKILEEKDKSQYIKYLDKILDFLAHASNGASEDTNFNFEEIIDKIKFLKEMNKNLMFFYLPLNIDGDLQDTVMTIIRKKRRASTSKNRTNIFININTKSLGNIKISCLIQGHQMDLEFSGIKESSLALFKSNEDKLRNLIKTTDYSLRKIEYLAENKTNILNSLVVNRGIVYNLDVQV